MKNNIYHLSQLLDWLNQKITRATDGKYKHRRLQEKIDSRSLIISELTSVIDKAHEDARYHISSLLENPLDPFEDFDKSRTDISLLNDYPKKLHLQTLKGYFGEIFAGIIAETLSPFELTWEVPAFLFRFHNTAFEQLERNSQTEEDYRQIPGRTGEDCVAFYRDIEGKVLSSLFCEAKCTISHQSNMIAEAHEKISSTNLIPDNILQLIEIFKSYSDEDSQQWLNSLRKLRLSSKKLNYNYQRYDLVSYICGLPPAKEETVIIPSDKPHEKYQGRRSLEAIEIHLHDVEGLIEEVYNKRDHIDEIKNNSVSEIELATIWEAILNSIKPENIQEDIRNTCQLVAFDKKTAVISVNHLSEFRKIQRKEENIKKAFTESGIFQTQQDGKIRIKLIVEKNRELQESPMIQPNSETLALAFEKLQELAGERLQPSLAKLYSQHTRLRSGTTGLTGWRENEATQRLDDVMQLLEASFIQKEAGNKHEWCNGMRRVGELLEWLSHPELNPEKLPIRLLSAAAYQLAGYPARASGLLNNNETNDSIESEILLSLLKADFPNLLKKLSQYWSNQLLLSHAVDLEFSEDKSNTFSAQFHQTIVRETASALGILCASMRWGYEPRLTKAIDKLSSISKVQLYGDNTYSWLLAKFCAEVAKVYVESSMRHHLESLFLSLNLFGKEVLERYLRHNYKTCKTLAWTSQIRGIEQLVTQESFVLCTPTGSGKTTVAELAILQNLFLENNSSNNINAPLVIYLVPSRALATEVESKLGSILKQINNNQQKVIVTSLYGGTDWGATDTWLTSEEKTILICTYEKAEAMLKFLGTLFLKRISLVIIDEAHQVQFDGNISNLQKSEDRALRLESLGTRLLTYLARNQNSRMIALSAVASELEEALASWISGQSNASPTKTYYRSTRQLIGRLECLPERRFKISYDLLDGASLEFDESEETENPKTLFIPNPFPDNYPPADKLENDKSSEKRLRPYLFWAAMNLAAPDNKGQKRAVLISITEGIGGYAEDFLNLLDKDWKDVKKPVFFQPPSDSEKKEVWQRCLKACKDYFTTKSREYQLLQKGIVVHYGKMPGLMSRLLIEVIDKRIVHLVMATSTLSEGVNLPFETVLIPSLKRYSGNLSLREFNNLVGRAGRPGFGTEGRSLVLLHQAPSQTSLRNTKTRQIKEKRSQYFSLIKELKATKNKDNEANAISPLAKLLSHLKEKWQQISNSNSDQLFLTWLENTAPINVENNDDVESLDSLDHILLSLIVELEQIEGQELSLDELEAQLKQIWQRSYAYYATQEEQILESIFITRGIALKTNIYQDSSQRRRLYRTSLPPRTGNQLLILYPDIKEHLIRGQDYVNYSSEEKLNYLKNIITDLNKISKFSLKKTRGQVIWEEILSWWLTHSQASKKPAKTQVSDWHKYVSDNFQYRFNWGLGSIIALAIDEAFNGEIIEPSLEDWPKTGLPWIVFWIKELMILGTLEPVAAYLLARVDDVTTRSQAEEIAQIYYESESIKSLVPNEKLNAKFIKDWVKNSFSNIPLSDSIPKPSRQFPVNLLRDFKNISSQKWKVIPVENGQEIYWFDLAGFKLAKCEKPDNWQSSYLNNYDFTLDASQQIVSSTKYL